MKTTTMALLLALSVPGPRAPADDLFDELTQQLGAAKLRQLSEQATASKAAASTHERAAEGQKQRAQALEAKDDLAKQRAAAAAPAEAARALEVVAKQIGRGEPAAADKLEAAGRNKAMATGVQALRAMAAYQAADH